jgi:hypothetical protein
MESVTNNTKSDRSWEDISFAEVSELYTEDMVKDMRTREAKMRARYQGLILDLVKRFGK